MMIALVIALLLAVTLLIVGLVRRQRTTVIAALPVKVILHTDPFTFQGVDTFSIMGSTMDRLKEIPFQSGPLIERETVLPKEQLVNLRGDVADEIHIFNPPGGTDGSFTTRKFLFRQNTLIGMTMGIDSAYLDKLVQETIQRRQ